MSESENVAKNRIEFQWGSKLQGTSSEALANYPSISTLHKIPEQHSNSHCKIDEESLLVGLVFSIESLLQRLAEIEMNDWLSFQRLVLC